MNKEQSNVLDKKKFQESAGWLVTRRDVLKASGLFLAGLSGCSQGIFRSEKPEKAASCFGIVTDTHYADTAARGTRYYRESVDKLTECVTFMNQQQIPVLVELGDFKDQNTPANEATTLENLETIEAVFRKFKGRRYHVLGNHDTDSISKKQFLRRVENSGIPEQSKYYSFDAEGVHCIVLDANYRSDGRDYDHGGFDWTDANVPDKERAWLEKDLAMTAKPVIVFIHQQLDGAGPHTVKNAPEVRALLEKSGKVCAVFQGHNHAGPYSTVNNIHYYTLKAMIEGSGKDHSSYAVAEVSPDNDIVVTGYRRAESRALARS